ncbi:MAG: hypothetical protein ACKVU4_06840 [Phycisphaerales bacterium]
MTTVKLTAGVCGLLMLGAAMGLAGRSAQIAQAPGKVPYVSWIGAHSAIQESRYARVRDQKEWDKLWLEHTGQAAPAAVGVPAGPEIDFGRCEVVACFRGKAKNSNGERVTAIDDLHDAVRIRFDSASYQTMSLQPGAEDRGVDCVPFGIWLIERTNKQIIVEENVQGVIGAPPVWREQKRFPAGR